MTMTTKKPHGGWRNTASATNGDRSPRPGRTPATPDASIRKAVDALRRAVNAATRRSGGHGISYATAMELWRDADELAAIIEELIVVSAKDYPEE